MKKYISVLVLLVSYLFSQTGLEIAQQIDEKEIIERIEKYKIQKKRFTQ